MGQFTVKQQYARVGYLGVSFMIMFTSFNSLQNIVSKLYQQYKYHNLGQSAIIAIYLTFAFCTIFTSYIIKSFGYKTVMAVSSLGYAVFQGTGLIIALDLGLPEGLVWAMVLFGAVVCGASASAIWVAQGAYTGQVASADRKSQLFGLFWALMMSSQILGNCLTTFVLGRVNNLVYFIVLTILGVSSATMFIFLPSIKKSQNQEQQKQKFSLKGQVHKIWLIVKSRKYRYLNIYFLFPGLTVAFYAGFLYKLVKLSNPRDQAKQSQTDYQTRLSELNGYVFITLGLSQLFTGIMMRFSEKFCKFKLAIVGTLIVEMAGFTSFITYFVESYALCFVCAFLWGCSETFLQTNTNALTSKLFPSNVEAFSVYRIFFGLGVSAILFLSIALDSFKPYIFLTIILILQCITTGISFQLLDLKPKQQQEQKQSLVSNQQQKAD